MAAARGPEPRPAGARSPGARPGRLGRVQIALLLARLVFVCVGPLGVIWGESGPGGLLCRVAAAATSAALFVPAWPWPPGSSWPRKLGSDSARVGLVAPSALPL